jgi:thymidylate synthase ThyX
MTEWWWSGSLDAFARMCKLRCATDTQYETRIVADQISRVMGDLFPVSWIVLGKLKSSRDMAIAERDRLNAIKVHRELKEHEAKDWAEIVFDIHAFNRVIECYGGDV